MGIIGCQGNEENTLGNQYTIDFILNDLKAQSDVFAITESPNKKYVAYMKRVGENNMGPAYLHIWRTGENSPVKSDKEEEWVGDLWWSPNDGYVFVDTGTFVFRMGNLYAVEGVTLYDGFKYEDVFFSPDGKKIIYTALDDKISEIKWRHIDPDKIKNLVLYDIETKKKEILFRGSDSLDYVAEGWIDNQTIKYDICKWALINKESPRIIKTTLYKYNLQTEENTVISSSDTNNPDATANNSEGNTTNKEERKTKRNSTGEQFTLDYILKNLEAQSDVHTITVSPNKKYIAYMKSGEADYYSESERLHIWRVGESAPVKSDKEEAYVGNLWWSPNNDYVFVDSGAYEPHAGNLYAIEEVALYDGFEYCEDVFYSPDGKKIIYTALDDKISEIKLKDTTDTIEPLEVFDIMLYDIETKKKEYLFRGADSFDYVAKGWTDNQTIKYEIRKWALKNEGLPEVIKTTLYKYNLQTEENTAM